MGNIYPEKWQPKHVERIMNFENQQGKLKLVVENMMKNSIFIYYFKSVSPQIIC